MTISDFARWLESENQRTRGIERHTIHRVQRRLAELFPETADESWVGRVRESLEF